MQAQNQPQRMSLASYLLSSFVVLALAITISLIATSSAVFADDATYRYEVNPIGISDLQELVIISSETQSRLFGSDQIVETEYFYGGTTPRAGDGELLVFEPTRSATLGYRIVVRPGDLSSGTLELEDGGTWSSVESFTIANTDSEDFNIDEELENTQEIVSGDGDGEADGSESRCVNEGGFFGFLACSALTWTLDRMEDVQTWMVEVLFETSPLVVGDTDDPLYQTWSNIRNVANSLLIIAFMAVIFSLAMSLNVDAYTVKRMVPRLLIAAVTIQASYFISAIFVDITNILGSGLQDLTDIAMSGVRPKFGGAAGTGGYLALGGILAGGTKLALLAAPSIGIILIIFLLVMLGAFLIIALRDLFIIAAVVLSPLAFLANLLPNTERWFKFWWSNFARLLLMYPFIILMIQLGNLGAYMVLFDNRGNAIEGFLAPFMAIIMQIAAIVSIYFAFKVGGSILSLSANGFQKFTKGAASKTKTGKGLREKVRANAQQRKSEYAAGARGNRGARAVVAPSSRATRKSRALATAELERNTAAAGKELEEAGVTDPEALKNLANYGDSGKKLGGRINALKTSQHFNDDGTRNTNREDRDRQIATQLERALPYAGKRSHQAAAFRAAAGSGFVDNRDGSLSQSFDHMDELFSNNPDFSQNLRTQAAVAANKEGRKDIWAKHGPLPGANAREKSRNVVQGMSREDFRRLAPASLRDQDFASGLRDQVDPSSAQFSEGTRNYLAGALSDFDGIGAAKHEEYRGALGDELYRDLVNRGNSAGGTGGGASAGGSGSSGGQTRPPSDTGRGQSPTTTGNDDEVWRQYDDMHARLTDRLGREPNQREINDQYAEEAGRRYTDTGQEWQRNPDGSWTPRQE